MLEIIGIGSIFVDYFLETEVECLKKIGLGIENECLWWSNFDQQQKKFLIDLGIKTKSLGGMSVNTIMLLSKLGIKCGVWGILGNDEDGKFVKDRIKKIDTTEIKTGGNTAQCFCLITNKGKERTFVTYPNIDEDNVFENINFDYINKAKWIHLSPFFTKDMKLTFKKVEELVKKIDGPKLTFTPSTTYVSYGLDKLKPILKKTEILFLNKWEMEMLNNSVNFEEDSKKLLGYGPKIVVCTLGSDGVLVTTENKQFYQKALKPKKIIDSTGAGDSFAGGFLYGLIKNKTLEESAKIATKLASMSLSDYGQNWLNGLIDNFD